MIFSSRPSLIIPSNFSPSSHKFVFIITTLSDSTIMKIGEISRVANTVIFATGLKTTVISDSAIHREGFDDIQVLSITDIKNTFQLNLSSLSKVVTPFIEAVLSDSTIFRSQFGDIQTSSDARIVLEGTIMVPPTFSDTRILEEELEVTKTSDSFIVLGQQIDKLSDTAIHRLGYVDINIFTDSTIFRTGFDNKQKLSNSAIFKSGLEITILSDTRIFRPGGYIYPLQRQLKITNTRVKNLGFQIDITSASRINLGDNSFNKLSDTLIILNPDINVTSDSLINVLDNLITIHHSVTRILSIQKIIKLSDSIIKIFDNKITKLSDTLIHFEPTINIISDVRMKVSFELSGVNSDSRLIKTFKTTINSDSTVYNIGFGDIKILSLSRIYKPDFNTKIITSNIRIKSIITKNTLSDTSIRRDRANITALFQKSRQV